MDDHDGWIRDEGINRLEAGRAALQTARELAARGALAQAEVEVRGALDMLRSAMNWLEDTDDDLFDQAHEELDQAGHFTRTTFGCLLHRDGTTYQQRCPVALAHNRIGFSPALLIKKAECSICHEDPAQCLHVTGRVYDGQRCARVLKEFDVLEISLVARPAQPDARIVSVNVSHGELREALGNDFEPGIDVNCDGCLAPCPGLARPYG